MKGQKILSLDIENLERLKEVKNSSKLINDYLTDYFSIGVREKEEIKKQLQRLKENKADIKKKETILKFKLEKEIKKEKNIEKETKELPKEVTDDFKFFPKMTEDTLKERYDITYSRKYKKLDWKKVVEAFRRIKNGN
jgi:hypothetical protein